MLNSLKAKLTLAFGSLMVLLFVALGVFLIDNKSKELTTDISQSTQSFAEFTVGTVMDAYVQFLEPGNFIPFNKEINGVLRQNTEISSVNVVSHGGVLLYDSAEEKSSQYTGTVRTVGVQDTLDRVQSTRNSVLLESGRVLYVDVDEDKNLSYVDFNEIPVEAITDKDRIVDIIVPYANTNAVIYNVNYDSLEARLNTARLQIILFAAAGFILTLIVSFVLSASVTRPINALKEGALKIAGGDFRTRVKVRSKDEVGVLAETFNQMARDLAKSTKAMIYQERLEKELELASQIQNDLLPKEKKTLKKFDLAGGLIPATEIGGDAFDYIEMNDGRHLTYLGDVTGHGVPAGIISSIANALLYSMRDEKSVLTIVRKLNTIIRQKTTQKLFLTMALLMIDDSKSKITYVNAGHPPVLYYDSKKKKVIELPLQGIAMGLADDMKKGMKELDVKMHSNDVLVMYSDGIPEATSGKKGEYGMAKLKRIMQDAANDLQTAEGIKNAILSDVIEYIGKAAHTDDITVVVIKRRK